MQALMGASAALVAAALAILRLASLYPKGLEMHHVAAGLASAALALGVGGLVAALFMNLVTVSG